MTQFQQIYFDSNVLVRAGWPRLSAKLQDLLRLASITRVPAFVPEVVLHELDAHWAREFQEKRGKAIKEAAKLGGFVRDVFDVPAFPEPPDVAFAVEKYQAAVSSILQNSDWRIEIIPITKRPIQEFLEMAFHRIGPFRDQGAGFQDAVICMSVIDHLALTPERLGGLVTADGDYDAASIAALAAENKARLTLLPSLEAASDNLVERLQEAIQRAWTDDQRQAKDSLQADLDNIVKFIGDNLQILEGQISLTGMLLGVQGMKALEVERVSTTHPLKRETGKPIALSADVKIELLVLVERYAWTPPRIFKVGQASEAPSNPLLAPLMKEGRFEEKVEAVVELEAVAQKEADRYVHMEYNSVRLKEAPRRRFGGLSAEALLAGRRA